MVNYILATDITDSKTETWRQKLIESMSPINNPGSKGIIINQIKLWHVRVYENDEKKLCQKLKTFNAMDHKGGIQRVWRPEINFIFSLFRNILGLGGIPITESHHIPTDGHVIVLGRIRDQKTKGREFR